MPRKNRYAGNIDIPERTVGEYSIKHLNREAGATFNTANARCVLLGGQRNRSVQYGFPTRWHQLIGPTGVWMTDLPIEQAQHDLILRPIKRGRVLVGGLGLGYAAAVLARRKEIDQVCIVEISSEVIELVLASLERTLGRNAKKLMVFRDDLFEFLKRLQTGTYPFGFDAAFYDIWQADSEGTFHDIVVPLHQLSKDVVKTEPICWNEDVMRGQLRMGLRHRALVTDEEAQRKLGFPEFPDRKFLSTRGDDKWINWSVSFFQRLENRQIGKEGFTAKHLDKLCTSYSFFYGKANWEENWNAYADRVFDGRED